MQTDAPSIKAAHIGKTGRRGLSVKPYVYRGGEPWTPKKSR